MMFSDEEIKEMPGSGFMRPMDEIISIREVCLSDKFDKKGIGYNGEPLLSTSGRSDLDVPRSLFRDGFFPDGLDPSQAKFAWTEEDGNIAALVSEPGFGTTGQTTFGKDLDAALKSEMKIQSKDADTSSSVFQETILSRNGLTFSKKIFDSNVVTSTSSTSAGKDGRKNPPNCKIDKEDPRSRFHYVKYVKKHGRTVKLWECGMCGREFQHQYTLMRHLPTHTDERNFHCNACGKSFRQLSTLSQHRAIHSSERPYSCEVCNKTFNRVSTLISHRKTHSNDKPYKCHICPKGFHQKGNLRNHLFTHTNERPYRCNICFKGFNQQSNLVCHKNKAHPEDNSPTVVCDKPAPHPSTSRNATETQIDSSRPQPEHCEVSSSVGSYPCTNGPPTSNWTPKPESWEVPHSFVEATELWENPWVSQSGVIVDPIKTYHMRVALATRQTPFALLKPNDGAPVLVKVVDTKLPNGKQMLVPATAEDLRIGGKIVVNNESEDMKVTHPVESGAATNAVQIRVPVVATVVPCINPGGGLSLKVEEPHHAYHTALSTDAGVMTSESCTPKVEPIAGPSNAQPAKEKLLLATATSYENRLRPGSSMTSSCALPPPPPSPPLDLISLDLFEPIESIPLGPQIIPVDNIDHPPPSDDSDIFIGEFEECIQLSDSE